MNLPKPLLPELQAALNGLGDATAIVSARTLEGGCINNALRLDTEKRPYFLKWNADPLPGIFITEAQGLNLLASTHTVRVPEVYAYSDTKDGVPAYILMEWLEGSDEGGMAQLGRQIAQLHIAGVSPQDPPAYGLSGGNYVGFIAQRNAWVTDWPRFFAEYRLRPQLEEAETRGNLTPERRRKVEKVIERLPDWISGVERRPCLVHGDLWSGNILPGPTGLALIDPSVSYADREVEIAYTQLFGGSFNNEFYAAYNEVWPLEPGYADRRDLYNLYHMLNHLNHFGEQYAPYVDGMLNRYVGN